MAGGTVLVVSAMPIELRPLVRALGLRAGRLGGDEVRTGRAGTTAVVASVVGVGPAAARRAAGRLLDGLDVARVLMIGVAGGVAPSFPVGTVMAPASVVDQASGQALRPDHASGVEPAGTLLTCTAIVHGADRARLQDGGVDAVDMETAAVGAACRERGVRWAAYRAISDTLEDGLVDDAVLGLTRTDGSTDPAAVARLLVRRPSSARRLVRLGRDTRTAVAAVTATAVQDLSRA